MENRLRFSKGHGPQTDHHRCFGLWRRRARRASVAVAGALAGTGAATLLSSAPHLAIVGIAALLGAVVATAVWQELP